MTPDASEAGRPESTLSVDGEERFARGFVTASYLLGRRGSELEPPALKHPHVKQRVRQLIAHLTQPSRQQRAKALAFELTKLIQALEDRRLR